MTARFSNGQTLLISGDPDKFKLYGAILDVRLSLTSKLAATASYSLHYQRYSNPAALPTGFPAQYERRAFLIGLTLWSRLTGTLPVRPRAPGDW